MNYQEAIEWIKKYSIPNCRTCGFKDTENCDKDYCACEAEGLKYAISAMQELQEYKQLGTLVEVREAMQELKLYKDAKLCLIPEDVFSKQCEEVDAYREIGTLEEVKDAMERQRAKKPNNVGAEGYRYTKTYRCPTCGGNFSGTGIANYCYHCGQKLDWEEIKE